MPITMQRDPRSPDSDLPSTELRSDGIRISDPQGTQIWALYPAAAPAEHAEPSLARLLGLLLAIARARRRQLALGALIGVSFGAAYLIFADPIYVVKALLHVEVRESVIREYAEVRAGSSFVATQAEVIQSPEMIADAIRAIGLPTPDDSGLLARLKAWVRSFLPEQAAPDPLATAVLATAPVLQASPVLGTDIMAVTLRTVDPDRGAKLLEALIASYRHYVRENETAAHREGLELLREREASLDTQIAQLGEQYEEQRSRFQLLGDEDGAMSVQRLSLEEHAKARVDAQRHRIEIENELAELRAQSDPKVAPDPRVLEEVVRAEAALAELKATVSPRHPDVRQMEERVTGLREQVHQGAMSRIDDLERSARAARKSEARLAELYDSEWKTVQGLETERAAVNKLRAEIARLEDQRKAVMALLGEKELSLLAQGSEHSGTLIRVLEAPAVPPEAIWPLPIPVLLACGVVGVLGGLGYALLAERRRRAREPKSEPVHLEPLDDLDDLEDLDPTPPRLAQRRVSEL